MLQSFAHLALKRVAGSDDCAGLWFSVGLDGEEPSFLKKLMTIEGWQCQKKAGYNELAFG